MSKPTSCDIHAWQPVPLPDGRTVILCGKCGEHALTLWDQPIVLPTIPAIPQPYTITYQTFTAGASAEPSGYPLADTMSGTSAPGSGIRLS
jgi:hypothetical protein